MTFNFDGGDILVILLVVVAFFLFRRFDRTGRSLEKVRRYADKSRQELDTIVRERELGLRDLSVDLEVQEKTNREILSRVEVAREEILSRAEELEGRVERIEAHERALEELNDLAVRVDENLRRLRDESGYVDDVGIRLSEVKEKIASLDARDEQRFAAFRDETLSRYGSDLETLGLSLAETDRQLAMFRENLESLNARQDQQVEERIAMFRDELEGVEEDYRERLRKVAEEGIRLEDDAFTAMNEKISSRTERLESNWLGGLNELRDQVSATASEIRQSLSEARTSLSVWESESGERLEITEGHFQEIEERMEETSRRLEGGLEELRERLSKVVESKETDLLEAVEIRQNEYRRAVEERFERIELFIRDMDGVAASLRASQQQVIQDVRESFASFDADMSERRGLEKARIEEEEERLRREMADLERGLDELKSRAYDNVSEKLQVFEDEFFTDLRNRDTLMKAAFEEWKKNAELEMGELALRGTREREETERRYSTELKQRLSELQTRVFGQFQTFQDQVEGFRDSLTGRITTAEEDLAAFRGELSDRITREKKKSIEEFEKVNEVFNKEVDEKFSRANKIVGQRLTDFAKDIDTRRGELVAQYEKAREESDQWKARIDARIDETSRGTVEGIDIMKSEFAAMMSELKDEYAARTEQLVLESGEERTALRREIATLEESVMRLTDELKEKTRDSLDALKEQSENALLEFRKNSREARDEMERKIRELRQSVQESRDRAENNRKEMVAHTDAEYARLNRNLDEIDRRQREFIAETRVFERAEELKEALEADIAELRLQTERVGSGREEIQRINELYGRALSQYDEVSAKLTRFLSEQQKVENLEGKIARIGNLSEAVDVKLERVSEANDALQDLQVRLKQLEDLHEDLGVRYQKLTEKSVVLDAATDGVDKNFQRMDRIEQIIKEIGQKLLPLRDDLNEAEERQARLTAEREKIDLVIGKVSSIDTTIADLDRRLEDLGKAREWLARTETRLEEIDREMQQRIRLLGTLSKRETGGRKSPGSPDMSTREMVVKLAREGWNSEEIAANLKLSRGEVELILELQPKG